MKIIYLPGKSLKNKEEADVMTSFLVQHGYEVYFHHWNHWDAPENELTLEEEVNLIISKTKSFENDEVVIIGKSLGSYVSLKLIDKFKVIKLILLGIPTNDLDTFKLEEFPTILKPLAVPIYVIQNSEDPHGTPESVEDLLADVKYELIERDRSDHRYYYSDEVLQCLKENIPTKDE